MRTLFSETAKKSTVHNPWPAWQIYPRSIAKFKALESGVAVIKDINDIKGDAAEFITSIGKAHNEVLYVSMTRARYQAVVIGSRASKS